MLFKFFFLFLKTTLHTQSWQSEYIRKSHGEQSSCLFFYRLLFAWLWVLLLRALRTESSYNFHYLFCSSLSPSPSLLFLLYFKIIIQWLCQRFPSLESNLTNHCVLSWILHTEVFVTFFLLLYISHSLAVCATLANPVIQSKCFGVKFFPNVAGVANVNTNTSRP